MRRFTRALTAAAVVLVIPSLFAQRPQPMGGFRDNPMFLLTNKSVQEELKLTDAQTAKLTKMREDREAHMKKAFEEAKGDREKATELFKKLAEEGNKSAADFIKAELKPEQARRFHQIEIQAGGLNAFNRDDVKTALKLSDKQQEALKTLAAETQKDVSDIRKDAGRDREKLAAAQKKIDELNAKALEKAAEGLSADQKKAWKDLVGDKFELKVTPR
jgi:Spy/CpxP family protein refolding chaperone